MPLTVGDKLGPYEILASIGVWERFTEPKTLSWSAGYTNMMLNFWCTKHRDTHEIGLI